MPLPKYQDLWKAIIRPPRDVYDVSDLGPARFAVGPPGRQQIYMRKDFTLENRRKAKIECTHYKLVMTSNRVASPCVIYLHGNCSSRREAVDCLRTLYPLGVSIMCFDFCGCGLSEGEYVSLGWHERDDLDAVVSHLRKDSSVSTIGLWGRSMGAVTALLHGDRDPSIACMVLDSPFYSMRSLCEELAYSWRMPKFIVTMVMKLLMKTVKEKADFCIDDLEPIKHVDTTFIPSLFIAGTEDTFIQPHHCDRLHEKYAGDKELIKVSGDHNSARPKHVHDKIANFFALRLLHTADLLTPRVSSPLSARHLNSRGLMQQSGSTTASHLSTSHSVCTNNTSHSERGGGPAGQRRVLHTTHLSDMRPPERMNLFDFTSDGDYQGDVSGPRSIDPGLLTELQISADEYFENLIVMEQLEKSSRADPQ